LILVLARELLTVRAISAIETDGSHRGRARCLLKSELQASECLQPSRQAVTGWSCRDLVGAPNRSLVEDPAGVPLVVPFRTQHPLGVVVNRPSVWPDR
jgi:hypothetical protein